MELVPGFFILVLGLAILVPASGASGQAFTPIKVPDASPEASVGQTIGVTEVRINYHRPAVNKREIWGKLVPYNEVWRAGANENTTISFSSDVTAGGQKLPARTYGVDMLPTDKVWTRIFRNRARAWGSFSYDPKEDALRITVTPQPAEFQERLGYSFEGPTDTAPVPALRWEKVKVAFPIGVDTPQGVLPSIRRA